MRFMIELNTQRQVTFIVEHVFANAHRQYGHFERARHARAQYVESGEAGESGDLSDGANIGNQTCRTMAINESKIIYLV